MATGLSCGQFCRGCTAGKCVDPPTDHLPIEIACPECSRNGCNSCDGLGYFRLTSCPIAFAGDALRVVRFAWLARNGAWPIAGGALDQCKSFVDATTQIWREIDLYEDQARERRR